MQRRVGILVETVAAHSLGEIHQFVLRRTYVHKLVTSFLSLIYQIEPPSSSLADSFEMKALKVRIWDECESEEVGILSQQTLYRLMYCVWISFLSSPSHKPAFLHLVTFIFDGVNTQKFVCPRSSSGGSLKASVFGKLCCFLGSSGNMPGNGNWKVYIFSCVSTNKKSST